MKTKSPTITKREMLVSANRIALFAGANESLKEDLLAVMAGLDLALKEHDMGELKVQIGRR